MPPSSKIDAAAGVLFVVAIGVMFSRLPRFETNQHAVFPSPWIALSAILASIGVVLFGYSRPKMGVTAGLASAYVVTAGFEALPWHVEPRWVGLVLAGALAIGQIAWLLAVVKKPRRGHSAVAAAVRGSKSSTANRF